jgi:acetyl/propionyl-CoA carboxylase alpha subunit
VKITFDSHALNLTPAGSGKSFRADLGEKTVVVEIIRAKDGKLELLIDGSHVTAYVSKDGAKRWVTINGQTVVLTKSTDRRHKSTRHDHASGLAAPMPGLVRSVNVHEDESVTKGQTLMVLEAMKMEIQIHAPQEGVVKKLFVKQGETVEREQILIEIESPD